jgi:hypothetical protein
MYVDCVHILTHGKQVLEFRGLTISLFRSTRTGQKEIFHHFIYPYLSNCVTRIVYFYFFFI